MKSKVSFKKVVLVPGYQCNNHCVFCINRDKRDLPAKNTAEVLKEMKEASQRGCDYAEFAGGENAIRPDFPLLVKSAGTMGYKRVAVATNGRMFSYPGFAEKISENGLTDIIFSIHGHTPELHDRMTGVEGSFAQMLEGVRNMLRVFRGTVATNTAVTKINYRYLPEIGRFIAGHFGFTNSEFIFADPSQGGVKDSFDKLMPKISEAAPYMRKTLDLAAEKIKAEPEERKLLYNWGVRYVPVCYFQDYFPYQISEIREKIIYTNVQHITPDYINLNYIKGRQEISRVRPEKCRACRYYESCEGIWKEYVKHFGDGELTPVKG